MTGINNLNLKNFVSDSVTNVFDVMLSMETEAFIPDGPVATDSNKIIASVGFAGDIVGIISIQLEYDFAKHISATMLGLEPDEEIEAGDIHDVIGEIVNMIGGNVKTSFCDADLTCNLSIPSITYGSNFKISTKKDIKGDHFFFKHQQGVSQVELYFKTES